MLRGGKRQGAGRPTKAPEDIAHQHQMRLTDAQWKIYKENGGTKTLRYLLENNLFNC